MTPRKAAAAVADTIDTKIHTRALLVWLTISTWSARKYDRKITQEVNARMNASSDAGRYNKMLLPGDAKAYQTLITTASSVRTQHYTRTLAWSDEGYRLLPTAAYMDFNTWFREQSRIFDRALDEFVDAYPTMRRNAASLLNGAYRDDDYPSVLDIRKRFQLGVKFRPLPNFGDVRVELASDQVHAIEQQIQADIEAAVSTAVRDAWGRLHSVVARISERLNDPEAIFRDSLIENAQEICKTLKTLNVTQDADLEAMRVRVAQQLTTFSPDTLRDAPRVRKSVAADADKILDAMRAFYAPESE